MHCISIAFLYIQKYLGLKIYSTLKTPFIYVQVYPHFQIASYIKFINKSSGKGGSFEAVSRLPSNQRNDIIRSISVEMATEKLWVEAIVSNIDGGETFIGRKVGIIHGVHGSDAINRPWPTESDRAGPDRMRRSWMLRYFSKYDQFSKGFVLWGLSTTLFDYRSCRSKDPQLWGYYLGEK